MLHQTTSRRHFLRNSSLLVAGTAFFSIDTLSACTVGHKMPVETEFTLPKLNYGYDALEPFIDKMTMEIHHSKHHQAYINNLNKAIAGMEKKTYNLDAILKDMSKYADPVRNNAGGHYNHSLFWNLMHPAPNGGPKGDLSDAINASFGSFDKFKELFAEAAMKRFGSGWAWLVMSPDKKLVITSTPNQDNPLMDSATVKGTPILALDVWEHAYYLKYQNKRADYINAWWNVVNWEEVSLKFKG